MRPTVCSPDLTSVATVMIIANHGVQRSIRKGAQPPDTNAIPGHSSQSKGCQALSVASASGTMTQAGGSIKSIKRGSGVAKPTDIVGIKSNHPRTHRLQLD